MFYRDWNIQVESTRNRREVDIESSTIGTWRTMAKKFIFLWNERFVESGNKVSNQRFAARPRKRKTSTSRRCLISTGLPIIVRLLKSVSTSCRLYYRLKRQFAKHCILSDRLT